MAKEFEGPMEKEGRQLKELTTSLLKYKAREKATQKYAGDEIDDKAFNNMQKATSNTSDKMFTESEYNINATHKERMDYDFKAYRLLEKLYREDKAKISDIEDWDFDKYLSNLKTSYLEEKFINARKEDPDYYSEAGNMLRSVYSDDASQLILSAQNFKGDIPSRVHREKSRANISIEAPEAEQY